MMKKVVVIGVIILAVAGLVLCSSFRHKEKVWWEDNHVIAHSGGEVNGRRYTNSLEAWETSYERGVRIFDADCTFTPDGVLVLRHSWEDNLGQTDEAFEDSRVFEDNNGSTHYVMRNGGNAMDYETFIKTPIFGNLTPMTCVDMINFMVKHEDLYVATDVKGNVAKSYNYLVNLAKKMEAEEILERIVVSIYNYSDYDRVLSIYPFKNFAMRIYSATNYGEMANFCRERGIKAINVSKCYIKDDGVKDLIKEGFKIFVAVIDSETEMKEYINMGIHGCVSDVLSENIFR